MSTLYRYTLPVEQTEWKFDGHTEACFRWERGPRVQEAFAVMGAIEFADVDAAALLENDARVADDFDARARLRDVAG